MIQRFLSDLFNKIFPNRFDDEKTRLFKHTVFSFIGMAVILFFTALAVFFLSIEGKDDSTVPNVVGRDLLLGVRMIQDRQLVAHIEEVNSPDLPRYEILDQNPKGEANVKVGKKVTIFVNLGLARENLENYVGKHFQDVLASIESSGQSIQVEDMTWISSSRSYGTVIAQSPSEGTPLLRDRDTSLFLSVSLGPSGTKEVPALMGLGWEGAVRELINLEIPFNVAIREARANSNEEPGTVVSQSFEYGQTLPPNSFLNIVLATPSNLGSDEVFGIYEYTWNDFSDNVAFSLEVIPIRGQVRTLYEWKQPGGQIAIPYRLRDGDVLKFYVAGVEADTRTVIKARSE